MIVDVEYTPNRIEAVAAALVPVLLHQFFGSVHDTAGVASFTYNAHTMDARAGGAKVRCQVVKILRLGFSTLRHDKNPQSLLASASCATQRAASPIFVSHYLSALSSSACRISAN